MERPAPAVVRLVLLAVLGVVAVSSAGAVRAGELTLPEDRIVYSCGFDFILDICSMNPDGSDEVMLTNDGTNDHDPEVSPSGQQIAWTKFSDQVWVMDVDGSNAHILGKFGAPVFAPTWSPTGTMLAFGCWTQGSPDQGICTANADGSGRELVFESLGATQPDWSPNGSKIAFESEFGLDALDIFVLDLKSGEAINVTNTAGLDEHGARWSPDGLRIAFWGESGMAVNKAYVMDANGANREVLFSPMFFAHPSSPAWSPDGLQVALICDHTVSSDRELCVVDVKSRELVDDIELASTHPSEGWTEPFWGSTGGTQQGDVDCNGSADTVDYLKILRYVAGLGVTHNNPCPEIGDDFGKAAPALWGDLDCNGTIDSVDALKGLRFVAALPVVQNEPCWDLGSIVVPA